MAVEFEYDGPIFIIRLLGTLEPADLVRISAKVLDVEAQSAEAPPRLADFRGLSDLKIGFIDMSELADRSIARPLANRIKSALLISQPVQLGFARMFETLNTHPMVTIRIFDDEKAARAWLLCG